ncbi:MAG: hypothetical protein PHT19_01545 [Methylococcus sp.]|nr:hypothetical protein [Methylococcus sp.]
MTDPPANDDRTPEAGTAGALKKTDGLSFKCEEALEEQRMKILAKTLFAVLCFGAETQAAGYNWDAERENRKKLMPGFMKDMHETYMKAWKRRMPQHIRPTNKALDPEFDDSIPTKKPLKECIKPGNLIDDQVLRCMQGK